MKQFIKAIDQGQKAINRIKHDLEKYNVEIFLMPDWEEIIESLIFLKGYLACLDSQDVAKKVRESVYENLI